MDVEKFREELNALEVVNTKWKEKMMSVTKLYKSLGYGLKDILDNENILIDNVYFYIGMILDKITFPSTQDFYTHVLIQRESKDLDKVREKLTVEKIKDMLIGKHTKKREDINNEEAFINQKYIDLGYRTVKTLIKNQKFLPNMINYLTNKHGANSAKELLKNMSDEDGGIRYVTEFITENKDAYKAFQTVFINELLNEEKRLRVEIKNGLINRITKITSFFDKCGYLEEAMNINNSIMDKNAIPMRVSMEDNKADFNIKNLLSEKYFEQFTNEELFVLSAHYSNRLEKIVHNLNEGIYLHLKLGTFYDSVDYDEIPRKIDSADARVVIKQKNFLEKLSRDKFKTLMNSVNDDTNVEQLDLSYVPKEYIKEYQKVYREYFDRYIRNMDNDFERDYRYVFLNRSVSYCMYALKDFSIESLLYTLSQNKSKINFGIIKEDKKVENEYGEEQVLIGVDYKEFPTMRLHFPKEDFDEFVDRFFPEKDFPIYMGSEDFNIGGTSIKTQLVYKFTKKQKQAIKKEMEQELKNNGKTQRYYFLRHMYANIHPSKNQELDSI